MELVSYICTLHVCLGGFAKLRKAAICFTVSVRMEQLGSHWTDFHEISYCRSFLFCVLISFRKPVPCTCLGTFVQWAGFHTCFCALPRQTWTVCERLWPTEVAGHDASSACEGKGTRVRCACDDELRQQLVKLASYHFGTIHVSS